MKIPFIIIILIWATTTIASISRNGDSSVHPRADIAIGDGIINSIRTEHEGNTSDANTASTNAIEPYPTTDTQDPLDTSLPGTSENRATINALGLNCRGSARCPSCNTGIDQILESLSQIRPSILPKRRENRVPPVLFVSRMHGGASRGAVRICAEDGETGDYICV
ncbi:hypothetical protein ACJQWK_05727 [Exserohilum turcicum]